MSTERDVVAKPGRHLLATTLAITALAGVVPPAEADTFIKFEGIKGESTDAKHQGEVDVLSWSWGVLGPTADAKGKLQAACADQMSLSKFVDIASPDLFNAATLNRTIPSAKLVVRSSGNNPIEYLVIDLGGVTVKTVNQSAGGGDGRALEHVSLGFTSAKITYKAQSATGGAGATTVGFAPAACP